MICLTRRVGIGDVVPSRVSTAEKPAAHQVRPSPRPSRPTGEDGWWQWSQRLEG